MEIYVDDNKVTVEFFLNAFKYKQFSEEDKAKLTFYNCHQYRFGAPDDEGFYSYNQSRYKKYGIKWGEFYLVHNSDWGDNFPNPIVVGEKCENLNHYLFYFRDETFECIAQDYSVEFIIR